jgi:hypothetical protein
MKVPLYFGEVVAKHVLLKCSETKKRREDSVCTV